MANAQLMHTLTTFPLPLLIDGMGNAFQTQYAAWPFRFYILHGRCAEGGGARVAHKAQPSPVTHAYYIDDIRAWLYAHLSAKANPNPKPATLSPSNAMAPDQL